jgi:hypothetical protein
MDIVIIVCQCTHNATIEAIMIRTQILIEENQINWLRDRAREKGVSVSQSIREGVEIYRKYKDRIPEDQKKKALAAIGRYASRVSDIS